MATLKLNIAMKYIAVMFLIFAVNLSDHILRTCSDHSVRRKLSGGSTL